MQKLRTVVSDHTAENPQFQLIEKFCDYYGYKLELIKDTRALMVESRGHCNPASGFIVYFLGKQCFDIFDLVNVIQETGTRQC